MEGEKKKIFFSRSMMGVVVSLAVDLSGCSETAGFKRFTDAGDSHVPFGKVGVGGGNQVWDAQLFILKGG